MLRLDKAAPDPVVDVVVVDPILFEFPFPVVSEACIPEVIGLDVTGLEVIGSVVKMHALFPLHTSHSSI